MDIMSLLALILAKQGGSGGGGSASDNLYPVEIGVTSLDNIAEAVAENKLPVVFDGSLIYFYNENENGVAHFVAAYGYNDQGVTGGGFNCLDYDGTDATTYEVELATTDDLAAKQDAATEVTNASSGAVSQACEDNTIYTFTGALTSLTLTAASGAREYIVIFTTGSTAPTVTPPTGVVFPDGTNTFIAEANKRYEISVRDGFALVGSWAVSA